MNKHRFSAPPRRVALFVTCMVDALFPEVGMATVRLLRAQGLEVRFPPEQSCCGQPAFNAGYRDEARAMARHFLATFAPLVERGEVEAIVAPSGSCVAMSSHFYALLFEEAAASADQQRAERLAARTFELSEFLVDVLGLSDVGAPYQGRVAYHACCHLLRELRVDAQPRHLLANMQGATVVPLTEAEECCGFGGLFAIKNAPISHAMGQRKVETLLASGADNLALCDVSCMAHLNGLLQRQGHSCRATHLALLLDQAGGNSEG